MRKVEVAAPKGTGENTPELKKKGGRRAEKKTVTSEQCQQLTESSHRERDVRGAPGWQIQSARAASTFQSITQIRASD